MAVSGRHEFMSLLLALPSRTKPVSHSAHVHDAQKRYVTAGGIRSLSMKHMKMSVPRDCGIRYGALILALLFACPALAYKGEKLAKDAKISMAEARTIALKAHPGKITDEELEREAGGTGLHYSFDIKNGSSTQEVGVDARTGDILENATEGENPD
ncbi:PepSY domain-containing protein [Methylocapsa sp. D3K7]|uniref:PepSY domain-containing protein n=1 Tax=Methylocapsa sp. D3K7 TaxID=3041435 RepID=UPI00244EB89C|nr:PepSY domain-containing protein [Methylocapsa sp. D3K7]WGJ16266.1 PepSY domain-containing protein [Methylocapsa sp. D3K7]